MKWLAGPIQFDQIQFGKTQPFQDKSIFYSIRCNVIYPFVLYSFAIDHSLFLKPIPTPKLGLSTYSLSQNYNISREFHQPSVLRVFAYEGGFNTWRSPFASLSLFQRSLIIV